jgi:multidrug efflux pump subunit AcrA (membrane-fusion protein)
MLTTGIVVVAAVSLSACKEVETETATGYEPAKLEAVKGNEDIKLVTFTEEGAERTGVETGKVRRESGRTVVPYAALIYDPEGKTFVYTSPKRLTYLRAPVKVSRIAGQKVFVSDGPPAGTDVVTVGTAEVYGTELEVASH